MFCVTDLPLSPSPVQNIPIFWEFPPTKTSEVVSKKYCLIDLSGNIYDLFFEVGKENWTQNITKRERYIDEVSKYFGTTLNIVQDKKPSDNEHKEKTKNIGSKEEPNLRLHHVDIRELFRISNGSYDIFNKMLDMCSSIETNFDATNYTYEQMKLLVNKYIIAILEI